ncbi:MAG: hypothetical protein U0359_11695 [Byssovorax sp.]
MAYTRFEGCGVIVFGSRPPEPAEWRAYADFLRGMAEGKQRGILFSEGGSLEPYQRKEADAILGSHKEHDRRIAVVTSSTFTWGFVKALSLFDPSYRSFHPDELDRAMAYVGLPRSAHREVTALAASLRAQVV